MVVIVMAAIEVLLASIFCFDTTKDLLRYAVIGWGIFILTPMLGALWSAIEECGKLEKERDQRGD